MKILIIEDHENIEEEQNIFSQVTLNNNFDIVSIPLSKFLHLKSKVDFYDFDMIGIGLTNQSLALPGTLDSFTKLIRFPIKLVPVFLYSLEQESLKLKHRLIQKLRNMNLCVIGNIKKDDMREYTLTVMDQLEEAYRKFKEEDYLLKSNQIGFAYCRVKTNNPLLNSIKGIKVKSGAKHNKCASCKICLNQYGQINVENEET